MIAIDSSALIAIIRNEPEAFAFARIIRQTELVFITAPTRLECWATSLRTRDLPEAEAVQELIDQAGMATVPFDDALLALAMDGYARFGRGRGRANLNLGDCFSYALAKQRGLPLLFKGDDFRATDVEAAA